MFATVPGANTLTLFFILSYICGIRHNEAIKRESFRSETKFVIFTMIYLLRRRLHPGSPVRQKENYNPKGVIVVVVMVVIPVMPDVIAVPIPDIM